MIKNLQCDVLCIGGGGAGIVAAATAAQAGAQVLLVSKAPYGCGNTRIAGGLVLHPNISPRDSPENLMRDMVVGGEFLNDQSLVERFCERAHRATDLMEKFGLTFARKKSGELAPLPIPLGGHSIPRTLPGYSEGVPIGTALRSAAARTGVRVLDETVVLRLLQCGNEVAGALCLQWLTGEMLAVSAKQTILATGGLGWLFYPHTSNMRTVTGDGYALALMAGAELLDMEHQQFIPFALTHPDSMIGIVCGEPAIAGPYGRLLDTKRRLILSNVRTRTRAEVAAAMSLAKEQGRATEYGGMLLDLSPNLRRVLGAKMFDFLKSTFPSMTDSIRRAYGEEAAQGKVPWDVFPTAHYQMGGVRVNPDCRVKGLKNLFAVGEVQGGLHGANRIGSTSLAELFIFGRLAGELAAKNAPHMSFPEAEPEFCSIAERFLGQSGRYRPIELIRRLQRTMWDKVGPIRDRTGLESAISEILEIRALSNDMRIAARRECNPEWLDAIELEKMLCTAEALARSALAREESRGGHVRLDYPNRNNKKWLKNVLVSMKDGRISVGTEDVALSKVRLDARGGPNPLRERIQFVILSALPRKTQARILDARLNLGEDA